MLRYVKLEILDLQPGNFKIETIHPIILTFGLFYLKYVKGTNSRDDKAFVWLDQAGQDAVSKGRPESSHMHRAIAKCKQLPCGTAGLARKCLRLPLVF